MGGQILAMFALASGLIETRVVEAEAFIRSLEMQREKFRIDKVPADMLAPMEPFSAHYVKRIRMSQ